MTLLVLCGLSCRTVAQTDTIADRTHHLEGVTVTETRRQQVVTSTVPQHLIDRQDMLVMGVTDIADALHRMSGITLRDYGGAGGMKTVSVRGFGSKHTGVSYDGVMLSECQSGEIDLSRYSLDNVDHLSLIIGDNDDIFIPARQATTPATLNIQTLKVHSDNLHPHLTTQLKVGSFGYVSPFLRYEQNLSERFAVSAVGEYTYAENDYPYTIQNVTETVSDRRQNSRMNSGHGELNFIYNNKVDRLTGKVYYYDNKRQLPGQVHYYTTLSGEELHDRNFFSQLMYQTRWGECWALRTHAKFNWVESVFRDHLYPGGVNDASYWQRESYASAALLYAPRRNWAFDYSADYAYNNFNGSSARTIVGRPYRHTVLQSATAKYTGHRLTVMGRLLCSIYINDSKEGNSARNMRRLSPSLSLSYLLSEAVPLRIRASYKNIFRSPTFNESYYYHYGSYDLKPESTDQFNVGLTWEKPSKEKNGTELQSTLDIYYNNVRDMIVTVPKTMFVWSCVNVGKVQVFGLDATIRATHRFCDDMKLTATTNYSYQRVQNMVSPESPHYKKQIAYMPEHTASASVGFEHPWVNTSLHVKETIIELRDSNGTGTQQEVCKFLVNYMGILEKQMQEPCDDAISRQDALRAFMYATNGERLPDYDCDNYPVTYDLRYIKKTLRALPPVTPQPKTGHWMIDEDSTDRFFATYECSCCKRAIIVPHDVMKAVYKDYPFCHCGAKMGKRSDKE